jgi:hypothetical protein
LTAAILYAKGLRRSILNMTAPKTRVLNFMIVVASLALASSAYGNTVDLFNDITGSTLPSSGLGIGGGNLQLGAYEFTVSGTYRFNSVGVALFTTPSASDQFTVSLLQNTTNVFGDLPGAVLESFTVNAPPLDFAAHVLTETSLLQPLLSTGNYWIEVAPVSANTHLAWIYPTPNTLDLGAYSQSHSIGTQQWGPGTQVQAGMEVTGNTVPEPASFGLSAFGIVALVAFRLRSTYRPKA